MLARSALLLSAALTGLLAGAMLFLRIVLVPFWQGLPPAEFRAWFTRHSDRIRGLMVPLGVGSAGTSLTAMGARRLSGEEARASSIAAGASAAVVAVTVTVNEPGNRRFVSGSLEDAETTALLTRWVRWHDLRVVLGLISAAAAVAALREGG